MTDREKLIDLLDDFPVQMEWHYNDELADYLIANGVTVRDNGKPLESFLHPVDAYNGLKDKDLVFKANTGEKVENCFVLRPDKDSAAVAALRTYAEAADNDTLANDIYCWVGKGTNVPSGWIPVTERLPVFYPEKRRTVLVTMKDDTGRYFTTTAKYSEVYDHWYEFRDWRFRDFEVVAWMLKPDAYEPPKEGKDNA